MKKPAPKRQSRKVAKPQAAPPQRRTFTAAIMDRLTADFPAPQTSADAENYVANRMLRGRARQLVRDNEYARGYLCLLDNNVLGAGGIKLEMAVKDPDGKMDNMANEAIKKAWLDWGRRENCSMSGNECWQDVESWTVRSTATDGGVLVREILNAPNPYGYAVDVFEIDCLDLDFNGQYGGNEVRFGIEFDTWRRPLAYHCWTQHPGDNTMGQPGGKKRIRFPASDVIHIFWKERPKQTIGVTWFAPVMLGLHHIGKYQESELIAARVAACKGYAIEQDMPNEWAGTPSGEDTREEMQPGMTMFLDPGQRLKPLDPTHPNSAFGDFIKNRLRGVASGLRINYASLANDLESANYSSMRAGKLEEVEEYMGIQNWLIESMHQRVFGHWLEESLLRGAIKMPNGSALPLAKFDKFNAPDWKPRRWPWVDPSKDLTAAVMAINNRLKSRRQIIAEMGGSLEKVDEEQENDGDLEHTAKPVQGAIVPQPSGQLTDDNE